MSLLLETTWGDLVVDLDLEGSPELAQNVLKLAKARYFTQTLVYHVHNSNSNTTHQDLQYCVAGCPRGDGKGGACIFGYLDTTNKVAEQSTQRFLRSLGRKLVDDNDTIVPRGTVLAMEMNGIPNTIGSQFAIMLQDLDLSKLDDEFWGDGNRRHHPELGFMLSLGKIAEDENQVLDKLASAYCDDNGRPYADVRFHRVLVVDDPFDDPPGMDQLLKERGVKMDSNRVIDSPSPVRPPGETVEERIQADEIDYDQIENDEEEGADPSKRAQALRQRELQAQRKEDHGRAVVLEMLGDLPSADIRAPENVLFLAKLNPITQDDDLELIFSRFDEKVKVEIIRDYETGQSLQYAFAEFTTKQAAVEAYFKMNNTIVDDRRIKVDFSQSVAKIWDKYRQKNRKAMPRHVDVLPQGGDHHRRGGSVGRGGDHRKWPPPSHQTQRHRYQGGRPDHGHFGKGERRGSWRGDRQYNRPEEDRHHRHTDDWEHERSERGREEDDDVDSFGRKRRRQHNDDRTRDDWRRDEEHRRRRDDWRGDAERHDRRRRDEDRSSHDDSYRRRAPDVRRDQHKRRRRRHDSSPESDVSSGGGRRRRRHHQRDERRQRHDSESDASGRAVNGRPGETESGSNYRDREHDNRKSARTDEAHRSRRDNSSARGERRDSGSETPSHSSDDSDSRGRRKRSSRNSSRKEHRRRHKRKKKRKRSRRRAREDSDSRSDESGGSQRRKCRRRGSEGVDPGTVEDDSQRDRKRNQRHHDDED